MMPDIKKKPSAAEAGSLLAPVITKKREGPKTIPKWLIAIITKKAHAIYQKKLHDHV